MSKSVRSSDFLCPVVIKKLQLRTDPHDVNLTESTNSAYMINYINGSYIFTFKMLLDLYLKKNLILYVAFIDYKKVFDSIDRISVAQIT